MLVHVDLYAGIAGFALACLWNGIPTILFVEIDKYCQKVLKKHWPNVPIVENIRDVEKIKEIVANATRGRQQQCEVWGETENESSEVDTNTRGRGTVAESPAILVTAGIPCQPFSVAGKRKGDRDDRYLWPETLAVIEAVKPKWVLLENVTGIINLALDTVLSDLEGAGYGHETLVIPACAVNAWHRRDRIWIVGNCNSYGFSRYTKTPQIQSKRGTTAPTMSSSQDVANTNREGLALRPEPDDGRGIIWQERQAPSQGNWWEVEPELGGLANGLSCWLDGYFDTEPSIPRVATGIKNRKERVQCLGNAIVPQVAFELIKVIREVDNEQV